MLSYRRELDGLRALAVVAVIVYHANLKMFGVQLFQGGFFGVDVFFVLSGYLITGIIRSQMEQGTFSFRDFYWRRAKRIVPALLTMLLVTSGLAYLILLPDDLVTYAKSLQSTLYFGSNYFFYGEDSYTAAASIYRPLLHTWSLSVEWQFYVVFPFVVWGVNRFFPRYLFGILLALALLSLQVSSFLVKVNPDMAFYLLPTRAWELILGGLVTFYNRSSIEDTVKGSLASIAYQSLPIIGLFLVVHSMIFIGHEVPHPSFITLLPVLGTCLFIMFSHKGEVSNDVMSLKPVVGIGLISYSLYLWHQPVFVFFRFIKHDYFRYEQFALLVIISLLLAVVTYISVESVYRKKELNSYVLSLPLLTILFLGVLIHQTIKHEGFPERYGKKIAESRMIRPESSLKMSLDGDVVTIGDSFIYQYDKVIKDFSDENKLTSSAFNFQQCAFVSSDIFFHPTYCSELNDRRWDEINNLKDKKIFILSANYNLFSRPYKRVDRNPKSSLNLGPTDDQRKIAEDKDIAWKSYAQNIDSLISLGHEVVVIYPVPIAGFNVNDEFKQNLNNLDRRIIENNNYTFAWIKNQASKLDFYITNNKVHKVYPEKVLCPDGKCIAYDAGGSYYHDHHHLSFYGTSMIFQHEMKELLLKLTAKQ
ncbi:acyltransferase family protein [Vibrio lentus]|uniref:acyltransferase family protein n=1 Tax=Vibrio lentus TaxID=136468 RepID=UPI000C823BC1|nr:acyltransferase family protein [Vibrio lentus]